MLPTLRPDHTRTLRSHLVVLTLVTLLPMIVFAVAASALFARRERATFQRGATERTLAVLTAVDAELQGSIAALEVLATSDTLDTDDLKSFHAEAASVVRGQPNWLTIHLAPPAERQVVNILRPLGAELPMATERPSFDRVLQTGKPAISNLVQSQLPPQRSFAVRVPVVRKGVTKLRPDVALIDVGLPGLDGYEVARRLAAVKGRESMRLIAITGYGQSEDRRRALDAGFDAHVTKPVAPEQLAELIDSGSEPPGPRLSD